MLVRCKHGEGTIAAAAFCEKANSKFGPCVLRTLGISDNFLDEAHPFFRTLASAGAVSSGILKGAQTVGVVATSAALFCGRDAAQCLTPPKACAALLVVAGSACYAAHAPPAPEKGKDGGGADDDGDVYEKLVDTAAVGASSSDALPPGARPRSPTTGPAGGGGLHKV